jgi:RNA polymerase sigma-70 factor (ECF subfamily)
VSTAFYNPNDLNVPRTGVPPRLAPTNAGYTFVKCLDSHPLSMSAVHNGDRRFGLSNVSEGDLISAAQMGDQRAFMELCGRHSGVTKQKIFRIVRNYEDTEDALQDTLLRAYTHLASFRRTCKFATWLTAIGVNSALMIIRKRRVRKEISASLGSQEGETVALLEPIDQSPGPEANFLKQQSILILRRELKRLKPSLRSIVDHYYGTECSLEEVAKEHQVSLGAAKSRLLRGRNRLRSSLARHGLSKLDK